MEMLIGLVVLIFSAIVHEVMHGVMAEKLGDPTARDAGRITLNPIPHIDPVMSIFIPALLIFGGSPVIFGAAKPVPINPIYFLDFKKDTALTAMAGPLTNIVIAVVAAFLIKFFPDLPIIVSSILFIIVQYNLILGVINLIPIPPLDGSRILGALLPDSLFRSYMSIEPFGILFVFFLLAFTSFGSLISFMVTYSLKLLGL